MLGALQFPVLAKLKITFNKFKRNPKETSAFRLVCVRICQICERVETDLVAAEIVERPLCEKSFSASKPMPFSKYVAFPVLHSP